MFPESENKIIVLFVSEENIDPYQEKCFSLMALIASASKPSKLEVKTLTQLEPGLLAWLVQIFSWV